MGFLRTAAVLLQFLPAESSPAVAVSVQVNLGQTSQNQKTPEKQRFGAGVRGQPSPDYCAPHGEICTHSGMKYRCCDSGDRCRKQKQKQGPAM